MTDEDGNFVGISGPTLDPLDENTSLAEILLACLRKPNPKSIAQVEVETSRELNYGHLARESLSVVQGLKAEGIHENSVVAVFSYNSQECHVIILASIFLGATVVPIDPSLTPEEMAGLLELSSPQLVFTEGGKTLRKVESAIALLNQDPIIVVSARHKHSYTPFQALLQRTDPEFKPTVTDPKDHVCMILYTSGTSGLPKGVMLTDLYLIFNVSILPRRNEHTLLLTSPIFWLSGVTLLFSSITNGLRLVFLRGPAKEDVILSTIHHYRPTIWFTSPTALVGILTSPNKNDYDLNSIQMLLSGGVVMSADTALRVQRDVFRNRIPVLQFFGMTEVGVITASMPSLNKPGSCGVLKPGVSVKVEDLETRECLGAGREGEICIKNKYLMKGYILDEEATTSCFDEDGWFHSGDIGYFDEDGFIFIVDRIKDLIKYKSYQIAPAELENVLRSHPAVKDVAVFGIPHLTDGDHATAFVVAKKAVSEQHLLDFVAERVSETKQLRGGVRFVEFIPKTSTGKPKRRALRSQLMAELQGISFMKRPSRSSSSRERKPLQNKHHHLIQSHLAWCST